MWAKEKDYLHKAIIISILFKLSQRVKMLKATKHKLSNNNFIYTLVRKLICDWPDYHIIVYNKTHKTVFDFRKIHVWPPLLISNMY